MYTTRIPWPKTRGAVRLSKKVIRQLARRQGALSSANASASDDDVTAR
jgi:hypothetical protein